MTNDELQMTGRDRWATLLNEAEQERRARGQQSDNAAIRPRRARGLVLLASWLDPATSPTRRVRPSL